MNNRDSVRDMQRFLRNISQHNNSVTTVIPDGIFGERTEKSLKSFQNEFGLPVTGRADYQTWMRLDEINRMYDGYKESPAPISPLPEYVFPLKPGRQSPYVYLLQAILMIISEKLGNFSVDISGIYDEKTSDAIKAIQRIAGISENGITDKETWNALAGIYTAVTKK